MNTSRPTRADRKELRSLKSSLILLLASFGILALLTSCEKETAAKDCGTLATVKDLTGLDGCGFVFELDNGEKLEPYISLRCETPAATPEESSLANFQLRAGQRVTIRYELLPDMVSVCMVGKTVTITCIEEVQTSGSF